MRLLDLGCGFAKYHEEYQDYEIIGIDIENDCIKKAKQNNKKGKYFVADVCKDISKIAKGKFDVVLSMDVLEHVREPRNHIENMLRYVSNDGYCFIQSPSALAYELNFRFHKGQDKINANVCQYLTPCVTKGLINRLGGEVIEQSLSCKYWVRPIRIKFKLKTDGNE